MTTSCVRLLVFVAGYHHSGTTLVQHMLLNASGHTVTGRASESWPASCNALPVLKHPTNTVADVDRLRSIRAHVAFVTRDGSNTVWSILKRRARTADVKTATDEVRSYCAVHCRWRTRPRANSTTLSLTRVTREGLPEALFDRVVPYRRVLSPGKSRPPPDVRHNELRTYQITHGLYAYNASRAMREASPAVYAVIKRADRCNCATAQRPSSNTRFLVG
jgi:hypothetical protein